MKSNYKINGAKLYRVVGNKPTAKIYKLPYIDGQGRQQPLKEIKKIARGKKGAYLIRFDDGKDKWVSVAELETNPNLLIKDPIVIMAKEKGYPF